MARNHFFLLLAIIPLITWGVMVVFVLLERMIYETKHHGLGWAIRNLQMLELDNLPSNERMEAAYAIIRRLPLSSVDRLVMSDTLPSWAREAAAVQGLLLRGSVQLHDAATSDRRSEAGKWRRIAALFLLAHDRAPDSHRLLRQALESDDDDLRNAAIALLGELGDRPAAELLVDSLTRRDSLRSRVAGQLEAMTVQTDDLLCGIAGHPDAEVRQCVALLLAKYNHLQPAMDRLQALAGDGDPAVRAAAAESLRGVACARHLVRNMLEDPAPSVRAAAIQSYGVDPSSVPAILPFLADLNWAVRNAVKTALVAIGEACIPQVERMLASQDRFARNGAAEVLYRLGVVQALREHARRAGAPHDDARMLRTIELAAERGPGHPAGPTG